MELKQVIAIAIGRNGGESLYFHDMDDDGQKERSGKCLYMEKRRYRI